MTNPYRTVRFLKAINSYRRPGGGPAPLLANPEPNMMLYSAVAHLIFFSLTLISTFIPLLLDINGCRDSNSTETAYIVMCCFASVLTAVYYAVMSLRKLGTEREWSRVVAASTTVVLLEGTAVFWGILILYEAFVAAWERGCLKRDAMFVFTAMTVTAAVACMAFSSILFLRTIRKIFRQLQQLSDHL